MRSRSGSRTTAARRFATVMAAVGALLVSSGIALMAAPTSASADPGGDAKVAVCKYVGTPGASRLQEGGNPIEVGVSTLKNAFPTKDAFDAWILEPTFPVAWTDAQGQASPTGSIAIGFIGTKAWTVVDCPGYQPEVKPAYADVQWIEPSCGTKASMKLKSGDPVDVTWSAPTATPAPGVTVSVTATALPGYSFNGSPTKTFTHTYAQVVPPEGQTYDPETGLCAAQELKQADAGVQWTEPSCGTVAGFRTTSGDPVDVTWSAPSAKPAPGVTVTLTATAMAGYTFEGQASRDFVHTYAQVTPPAGQTYDAVTGLCTAAAQPVVSPTTTTQVSPPKAHVKHETEVKAETTTPTVVEAGLTGSTTSTSLQVGLGLALAGLALMAGAAGVVLVGGDKEEHTA